MRCTFTCCIQSPLNVTGKHFDLASPNAGTHQGSPPKTSGQLRRQAGEASKPQADGDVSGIPQYYFEWAATIGELPGHEQGMTLAAMPEEDASNIRRILRHKARRQSQELTEDAMLGAAKQRSLRWLSQSLFDQTAQNCTFIPTLSRSDATPPPYQAAYSS